MTQQRFTPHVTVATIVERDNKFLMVKELDEQGNITFNQPAGHLEANESLIDAAVRETIEETGWIVEPLYFMGVSVFKAFNGITYCRTLFCAKPEKKIEDAKLDQGIIAAIWMNYEEIIDLKDFLRSPLVLSAVESYRQNFKLPLKSISYFDFYHR